MKNIEVVCKIGSMALVNRNNDDMDYNIISQLSKDLKPGCVLVSSGATEIGRLDYYKRNGKFLCSDSEENDKSDYAAQGQAILMENYRRFVNPLYSVRQLLVEHTHFNNNELRDNIKRMLLRSANQNAIPIINYNDPVSFEENRRMEISLLRSENKQFVECVDNDETAAQIAILLEAKYLIILTSVDGIFSDFSDESSLIRRITAKTADELKIVVRECEKACVGASRAGANGAKAKLEYVMPAVLNGTKVFIANAKYRIMDIINGNAPSTYVGIE